jgi:hypothetical protein
VPKKKQQTIAKRNREQAVHEKRRLKREKKQAVKAAKAAGLDPEQLEYDPVQGQFIVPELVEAEPDAEADATAEAEPEAEAAPEAEAPD